MPAMLAPQRTNVRVPVVRDHGRGGRDGGCSGTVRKSKFKDCDVGPLMHKILGLMWSDRSGIKNEIQKRMSNREPFTISSRLYIIGNVVRPNSGLEWVIGSLAQYNRFAERQERRRNRH